MAIKFCEFQSRLRVNQIERSNRLPPKPEHWRLSSAHVKTCFNPNIMVSSSLYCRNIIILSKYQYIIILSLSTVAPHSSSTDFCRTSSLVCCGSARQHVLWCYGPMWPHLTHTTDRIHITALYTSVATLTGPAIPTILPLYHQQTSPYNHNHKWKY